MGFPRLVFLAFCVGLFSLSAPAASASPTTGRDPAGAELLFREGRDAFKNGSYSVACQKFAESNRLDPAPGTLINLGACNEKLGRLASAWENWHGALDLMGPEDERRPRVESLIQGIEGRLARLQIDVKSAESAGLEVHRDGIALKEASFGVALPIDAGTHIVEVTGPGREPRRYSVDVKDGETRRIVVEPGPSLLEARTPVPSRPPEKKPAPTSAPPPRPTEATPPLRTWGYVVGSAGIAGLITGGIAGILALDRAAVIKDTCTASNDVYYCDDEGLNAAESGKTLEVVSMVGLGVGALALAAGGTMIILSRNRAEEVRVYAMPSGANLSWSTRF